MLLGKADAAGQGFTIDTKILCVGDASGSLQPAAIEKSLKESYERLGMHDAPANSVNVLYCHMPGLQTPLEAQAAGLDAQYKRGLFKKLGVSNFSPDMLTEFIEICERKGYVKPSVYQGQYNLICRGVEETLFPVLRKNGISFNAFSPLAGGFLTGQFTAGQTQGTRFEEGNVMGQFFRAQYDKKEMHDAIARVRETIEPLDISNAEASLRWIYHHSSLGLGDGVILGASRPSQLEQNLAGIAKGPLPAHVVAAIDDIWNSISK